jgi:uracil-DNA glycosylase family 4
MMGIFDESEFITRSTDYLCPQCSCAAYKDTAKTVAGAGRKKILVIGESPTDDLIDTFFSDILEKEGINLRDDCWETYAVRCRKADPPKSDIQCCKPYIDKLIRDKSPRFILLVGDSAISSMYGKEWTDCKAQRWRKLCIPDQKTNAWILPLVHSFEAFNKQEDNLWMSQFLRDVKFAVNCIKTIKNLPRDLDVPLKSNARYSKDFTEIKNELVQLLDDPPKLFFFDYETTGLKPYRTQHKIATASFATDNRDYAFAFPFQHDKYLGPIEQKWIMKHWRRILELKSKKVAHNAQFEDIWSRAICDVEPRAWHWCSMLGAHSIDNRSKFSGLKFQTYVNFGIPDYSKSIAKYLEEYPETPGYNRVLKAPISKLLEYSSFDSLTLKFLYYVQKSKFDDHLENGMDLFLDGILALGDVQMNGFNVDVDYYINTHHELEERIATREKALLNFPECKEFFNATGRLPNLGSPDDLRLMFFEILKLKSVKHTDKGSKSVDAEALATLKTPLAKEITALSQIKKIDGTYLKQFMREIDDDGRIHPNFSLHLVKTYRGSSDSPNLQNVPVRNEEAKRYTRSGIIPSPGHKIIDFDYSAIEVKMGCVYTLDPVLIAYCCDDSTDMHRDTAADIFELPPDKVTKKLRFFTKNGFVFPEWYGSYYKNCARNIWRECRDLPTGDEIPVIDHLTNIGILSRRGNPEEDFIDHVKNVERKYWEKFNVFKEWQENWYKKYEKTGYVELKTGFRCQGFLSRNAIVNYAFQGTAFHCLLWSLTQIAGVLREEKLRTKVIGQIHDCCILDNHPDEYDYLVPVCNEIATIEVRNRFDWINIPLAVEWEQTGIDQPWYLKEEFKEAS